PAAVQIRLMVANHAGKPLAWKFVWIRSGTMAATLHPVLGPLLESNAALSSFSLTGCGPVSGPSPLKHSIYRVPSRSVTDARLATYRGRSSLSQVWNSPQSSTV